MTPKKLQELTVASLEDLKGRDIVVLDVSDRTTVTDWMIVVTGTSQRHVKSLANEVVEKSKEAGVRPMGMEGETDGNWILVDLGDVLAHVMTEESREFYALEKLWGVLSPEEKAEAEREALEARDQSPDLSGDQSHDDKAAG